METITKYKAVDGSEWNSTEECLARDNMVSGVNSIMSQLEQIPDELNWDGYLQHDKKTINTVKSELFLLANCDGILKWWFDGQKKDHGATNKTLIDCHPSWMGRMLDGSCRPLERAYSRLCCVDDNCREYNQPYFTTHQSQVRDICRNK